MAMVTIIFSVIHANLKWWLWWYFGIGVYPTPEQWRIYTESNYAPLEKTELPWIGISTHYPFSRYVSLWGTRRQPEDAYTTLSSLGMLNPDKFMDNLPIRIEELTSNGF